MTSDGTDLAFGSVESLTGYDNVDQITGEPDSEMYLYDAATNSLRCITCRPSGARPMGESRISATKVRERNVEPGGRFVPPTISHLSRNLSADGKRLFFESDEALTPADTDGKRDVYEFELVGSGTCTSSTGAYVPAAGGCIYLISTGKGQGDSYFYEASANGDDVFFTTDDQLVGQDADGFVDLYDARVDGGLAAQNPPPSPPPCSGDGCKGSSTAAPAGQGPGSSSFSGPGNQNKAEQATAASGPRERAPNASKNTISHTSTRSITNSPNTIRSTGGPNERAADRIGSDPDQDEYHPPSPPPCDHRSLLLRVRRLARPRPTGLPPTLASPASTDRLAT